MVDWRANDSCMAKKNQNRNGFGSGRLEGKVAIVTGAGTGIGEAIALKFAREGARLVLGGLPDDPVKEVAGRIRDEGGEAIAYSGDLSNEGPARECVKVAQKTFGRIDVLVNNAGVFLDNAMIDWPIISGAE